MIITDICNHRVTQNDKCVNCGELIYAFEKQTCSQCLYFKIISDDIPICKKKLMTVLSDMHVYYKIKEGTCFISNEKE